MTEKFDFEQALEALKAGQPITGKDSVLSPLIKQLTGQDRPLDSGGGV